MNRNSKLRNVIDKFCIEIHLRHNIKSIYHFNGNIFFLFFFIDKSDGIVLPFQSSIRVQKITAFHPFLLTQNINQNKHISYKLISFPNQEDRKKHTSELQSRQYLVCRLLLEKK